MQLVNKTVNLDLTKIDGNAWSLLGSFRNAAKDENWTDAEIALVIEAAKSSDYDNLVATLAVHCSPIKDDDYDDDDNDTFDPWGDLEDDGIVD